jgi:hypothetical protein
MINRKNSKELKDEMEGFLDNLDWGSGMIPES